MHVYMYMTTAVALYLASSECVSRSHACLGVLGPRYCSTASQPSDRLVTLQRQIKTLPNHPNSGCSLLKTKTIKFAALSTSCVCHEQEQQEPWPKQQRNAGDMPELGVSKEYPWDHCLSEQCVASLKIHIAFHCHTF